MGAPKQGPGSTPGADLPPAQHSCVGWITGCEPQRGVLVDYEGNTAGPLPVLSTVPLTPEALSRAISERQRVVLLFAGGDPLRPLLVGLVQPPPAPLTEAVLEDMDRTGAGVIAKVDGKRVLIEGRDEIVLSCGKARITLRRNGRVSIQGVEVESSAVGNHRIKGGTVGIN